MSLSPTSSRCMAGPGENCGQNRSRTDKVILSSFQLNQLYRFLHSHHSRKVVTLYFCCIHLLPSLHPTILPSLFSAAMLLWSFID